MIEKWYKFIYHNTFFCLLLNLILITFSQQQEANYSEADIYSFLGQGIATDDLIPTDNVTTSIMNQEYPNQDNNTYIYQYYLGLESIAPIYQSSYEDDNNQTLSQISTDTSVAISAPAPSITFEPSISGNANSTPIVSPQIGVTPSSGASPWEGITTSGSIVPLVLFAPTNTQTPVVGQNLTSDSDTNQYPPTYNNMFFTSPNVTILVDQTNTSLPADTSYTYAVNSMSEETDFLYIDNSSQIPVYLYPVLISAPYENQANFSQPLIQAKNSTTDDQNNNSQWRSSFWQPSSVQYAPQNFTEFQLSYETMAEPEQDQTDELMFEVMDTALNQQYYYGYDSEVQQGSEIQLDGYDNTGQAWASALTPSDKQDTNQQSQQSQVRTIDICNAEQKSMSSLHEVTMVEMAAKVYRNFGKVTCIQYDGNVRECTGVTVGERLVMTAGNCILAESITNECVEIQFRRVEPENGYRLVTHEVVHTRIHDDYVRTMDDTHNVGLLLVQEHLQDNWMVLDPQLEPHCHINIVGFCDDNLWVDICPVIPPQFHRSVNNAEILQQCHNTFISGEDGMPLFQYCPNPFPTSSLLGITATKLYDQQQYFVRIDDKIIGFILEVMDEFNL